MKEMKLIRHIIFVNIGDGNRLMINSLNGLMSKINSTVAEIITKWEKLDSIVPHGEMESSLYDSLKKGGYLVKSYDEEISIKESTLQTLRDNHAKALAGQNSLTFILTYDCNFRCPYCFEGISGCGNFANEQDTSNHNKTAVMASELIDAALNLVGEKLKNIGLFGGEPLLPSNRHAIEYLISKAPDKSYSIITNGYHLEDFLDILSKLNIASIMVTLDGEEHTHNSRRYLANGEPTYRKILSGIEKCLKSNIPICIRMNLDSDNYDEANPLKKELIKSFSEYENLLSFEISPMMEASVSERNEMFTQLYTKELVERPSEDLQKMNRMLGKFTPIVNAITTGSRLHPVYSFCSAHDRGLLVDPYGNIFPCLLAVGVDDLAIGKYYPQIVLKENSIRNRNIDTIPECRQCKYSLLCGGGCPVGFSNYDDVFKPMCFNIMNEIHNILPMIFKAKEAHQR